MAKQYLVVVNSYGSKTGDKGVHYMSRDVFNHFYDRYKAYMVVDKPREDIEYMLDNGIMEGDSWIIQLLKVIKTIILSPFFSTDEKKILIDMTMKTVQNPREKLLKASKAMLGKEASPQDVAPDELACAESESGVIRQVYRDFPVMTYTPYLYDYLKKDKRFKITLDLKPGNIIISPTGYGKARVRGHTGIIMENDKIASNNSNNGLWEENYTIKTWVDRWRTKGGMPIYVFEAIG